MVGEEQFRPPSSEYFGHEFQPIGPEKIASYFEVGISHGTTEASLRSLLKEFGNDVELRFIATQNYKLVLGNELHDSLIDNNIVKGEKILRGVVKLYKPREVKILEVPSEIAQFFKAKSESLSDYQPALDIISKKLLDYVESLRQ